MFVVTLPRSAAKNPGIFALRAKRAGADVLEIRSDLTPALQPFVSCLPLLVSVRGTNDELCDLLTPVFVDIEESSDTVWLPKGAKLILSFHDHTKTPTFAALKTIVSRMQKQKPWAIKIATFVQSYDDLLTLEKLQNWLKENNLRSIVLGMGPKAHLSRVLSPLRNVFTYATLDPADAAAPGQLPMSMYALTKGRKHPKLFGILGGPHVTASLSPVIHNALFQRHNIDALYSCFPSENFSETMKSLAKLDIKGLSVTAPFKHDAFGAASKCEATVEKLGVANTLVRTSTPTYATASVGRPNPSPPGGGALSKRAWKGFITDSFGIREGYPMLAGVKTVAILGAGGALPSAIHAIQSLSPHARITVFARDPTKARKALKKFGVTVDALAKAPGFTADAVLCAVSEDVSLALPSPASKKSIAIDLRYGQDTRFLKDARKKKFHVEDGMNMLVHQALQQFTYFTGKPAYDDDAHYLRPILTSFLSSHGQ